MGLGRKLSSDYMTDFNHRLYEAVVKQVIERYDFHPEDDAQLIEFRELIRTVIELYTQPIKLVETEDLQ